jgi:hypothetical protein
LGAVILITLTPLHAIQIEKGVNINLNDIDLGIKLEKIIEKAKKYFSIFPLVKIVIKVFIKRCCNN